jgi:3-oxoacyl-[acyl-carrier-protein] synthase I
MSWWTRLWEESSPQVSGHSLSTASGTVAQQATSGALRLEVRSAGLCCAVGYSLGSAVAAMRANVDHFMQSTFAAPDGEPIKAASLPNTELWGTKRLALWLAAALRDCLQRDAVNSVLGGSAIELSRCAMLVLIGESKRPDVAGWRHDPATGLRPLISEALSLLGYDDLSLHPQSQVMALGPAGLGHALLTADRLLSNQKDIDTVLLVGVDSLLTSKLINHHLRHNRLMLQGNTNGFLPGEAAAALLLQRVHPGTSGLRLLAASQAVESAHWDPSSQPEDLPSAQPNRAQGLSDAVRQACHHADIAPTSLAFRVSDQNGEAWRARESANAITRVCQGGLRAPVHHTLADKLGDIGAATGPAALAYLHHLMAATSGRNSPGALGLIHLSNDLHLRCAVIVGQRVPS